MTTVEGRRGIAMKNLIVALLSALLMLAPGTSLASTPVVGFECPITKPGDQRPDADVSPYNANQQVVHGSGLWVDVPKDGVVKLYDDDELTFGRLEGWRSYTLTWLRDDGVDGFVEVAGQLLDEESDRSPQTPLSPQRQYNRLGPVTTGLAFPDAGCWEVTGFVDTEANEEVLVTFVVDVRFEERSPAPEECQYCRPPG